MIFSVYSPAGVEQYRVDVSVPPEIPEHVVVSFDASESDASRGARAKSGQIWTASTFLDYANTRVSSINDWRTANGGYLASGKWFHSDMVSRTQQLGLLALGQNIPSGLMWKTMDGTFVQMTPDLAQQILAAASAQDSATFSFRMNLMAALKKMDDPWTVDITVGWPTIYQDTIPGFTMPV